MVVAGWGPIIFQGGLRVFPCHWIHTCYGIAAAAAHWAARVLPTEATSSTRSARHIRCVRTGRWCLRLRWWWWCRLLRWRQYGSLWCCRPIPIHHLLPISGAVAAAAARRRSTTPSCVAERVCVQVIMIIGTVDRRSRLHCLLATVRRL